MVKNAIYWLGGLWRELTVGRGEENERAGSRRNMQLLDYTQMHFAHTEHTKYYALQHKEKQLFQK